MSGHSKWANIKNKKEKTDAQKGKIFTKIGREIAIAVKEGGGGDPVNNSKLRDVIAKAKAANMPNDNINRSIKKAIGDANAANYEEITYEGYGPGNIAVIVDVLTDNRNRIAAEMRHIFDKSGGNMGNSGSVSWMFDKKGQIIIERTALMDEDEVMMQALDAGAEDFIANDDSFEVYTAPNDFSAVRRTLFPSPGSIRPERGCKSPAGRRPLRAPDPPGKPAPDPGSQAGRTGRGRPGPGRGPAGNGSP